MTRTASDAFAALVETAGALARAGRFDAALSAIADAAPQLAQVRDKLLLLRFDIAAAANDAAALAAAQAAIADAALAQPALAPRLVASLRLRKRPQAAWQLLEKLEPTPALAAEAYALGLALVQADDNATAQAAFAFAVAAQPDFAQAQINLGDLLLQAHHFLQALAHFAAATRAQPALANGWLGLGQCLLHTGRGGEALHAFAQVHGAFAQSPQMLAWRATALAQNGDDDAALPLYRAALAGDARCFDAAFGLGLLLDRRGELAEAAAAYAHAHALQPNANLALGNYVYALRRLADWDALAAPEAQLLARLARGDSADYATQWIGLDLPGTALRAIAAQFSRAQAALQVPSDVARAFAARRATRLRIGYVSADFRNHATSRLLVEVLECHARERVEVFAYALAPPDDSPLATRVRAACEHFVDVSTMPTPQIAQRIVDDRIDVLVDLNGHTKGARSGLLALRPAPVIVNWLGFPGTLGAFADYILGDRWVIPYGSENEFSEAVVRLPASYQANDRARTIGAATTRAAHALRDDAIVACSFNQTWKFTPAIWSIWLGLLSRHPRLLLWLLDDNPGATHNLRQHTRRAGIDPARLVFAPRLPHPEHLARLALADIAFDTAPCGSHTTGSDALWMGVPLVTLVGRSFDARVGESLLQAVGLPQLVTRDADGYTAKLDQLIGAPEELAALKRTLLERRTTAALFDSEAMARALERAYTQMSDRFQAGLAPAAFDVAAEGREAP